MEWKKYEDLYRPEHYDPVKEARLLTKLGSYITQENFHAGLNFYMQEFIKAYQVLFTEIKESEKIEDKRDRLYIESTKLPFAAFITDTLLRYQFEINSDPDLPKISDDEIILANNAMTTLLNLDPNLQISTSRALTDIIQERNNQYQLKDNKDFLFKILNRNFESIEATLDLQNNLGIELKSPSLNKDSLNLSHLSPSELENVLSTCTMEQTHLGLQLICPPEIYKNYISPNSQGIVFSIDFEGKQNQIVCMTSESFYKTEVFEHESFHVIFNHIMNERKKKDSPSILPDIPKDIDSNDPTTIESFVIDRLEDINSAFLNELFAHSVNFKIDSSTINGIAEEYREEIYKFHFSEHKKGFRDSYFPMYLSAFDFMIQLFPEYFSDKNNLQELMDLKTKTVAEWESAIKRTYELIIKYNNFAELVSYTISISDMKNINKNLDRLEVFLEKYSKTSSMIR